MNYYAWLNYWAYNSAQQQTNTIKLLTTGKIKTVYVAVPSISGQYGHGDPDPQLFASFIAKLTAAKIKYHLWICSNFRPSPTGDTRSDYTVIAERNAQAKWCRDLLTAYPNALGIHADYFYFPWDDGAVVPIRCANIGAVADTARRIYEAIGSKKFSLAAIKSYPTKYTPDTDDVPPWFVAWKKANQTSTRYNAVDGGRPYLPDGITYGCDAVELLRAGVVSHLVTMTYYKAAEFAKFKADVDAFVSFLKFFGLSMAKLHVGLGWSLDEAVDLPPDDLIEQVAYCKSLGINNVCIFQLWRYERDLALMQALAAAGL